MTLRLAFQRGLSFVATLFVLLSYASAAQAQSQGWAGIVPGSNDYSNPIPHETPALACASHENSFVPFFGYQVGAVISVTSMGMYENTGNGIPVPATACRMDAGPNGTPTIVSLKGCTSGYKLVNGTCLPADYPVTAEPACKGAKGIPGQYPTVGDPVSLSTGAKCEEVSDYASGGPYPIEIKRYYRSMNMPQDANSVGLGLAWRTDLIGRKIKINENNYNVVVSREDGAQTRFLNPNNVGAGIDWPAYSIETYMKNGTTYVQSQGDARDRFRTGGSFYIYQDESDRSDYFTGRRLDKSIWKGGYQRNYVYASGDTGGVRPIQINDSLGRMINLTWNGNLISEIVVPGGVKIQYAYEARTTDSVVPSAMVLTQVTRRDANNALIDSRSYQYAPAPAGTQVPLLTGVIDAKGALVDSSTYDAIGRVLTAQGPNGANAVTVAYNDTNGTRTVANALGQADVYTVQKRGLSFPGDPDLSLLRMTSVARQQSATVAAATKSLVPDFDGYVKTDWNGVVTKTIYDAFQNETSRVEDVNGLARTTTTTWSPSFKLPTQIVQPNLTTNFTYDAEGRLTRREEIDTSARQTVTRAWTYTWTSLGLLATVTGPRTDVVQTTTYTYDATGNLATVKDALNRITAVNSVNAAGLPTSVTDQNNVVTLMTYDPLNRIKTVGVQGPTPATTSFGYDENGQLITITSPTNVTLTYGYDAAQRLTSITDGAGNKTVFGLDGLGNRTQTQIQTGSAQVLMANSATFDSLGRMLTSIGAVNQTTRYEYDNVGNLTRLIDPRNAATQIAFDGLNRVKQTTDALNGVTKTAYNLQDNVTSVTDAKLHATTYSVNGFGFVTQVTSPDTGATIYTYDLAGNIKSRKDARRVVTNYTYDALDRPLTRTFPSATADNVTFGYDSTVNGNLGVGRLTSLTDSAGTASFTYDAFGNRITERRTIAGVAYNTGYEYDLAGLLTRITYPSGRIVTYQRDGLGQVAAVTTQANSGSAAVALASGIGYRPFGPIETATLGNGVQLLNEYDLDYRLARARATGASALQDLTYGYDAASNVNAITDAMAANLNQTFQYDPVGRVTQGTGAFGTDNYTYDVLGNRLTRSLTNGATATTTYTYTAANTQLAKAVTGSQTLNYAYDATGSLLSRKLGNATQAAYVYNADMRLASSGTTALKYNAFGQRAIETVTGGGTHFLFDEDGMLLAEHGTAGGIVRNYVYLNGLPMAVIDAAGTINYVLNDHIGQPQKMANASGALNWHRVAGIYGDTVSQPVGTTAANPQRFPGQQFDPYLALHYNYFRDYDPATGRYLEADRIGLDGGANLYAYAEADPVNVIDPTGEFGLPGAIIGGGADLAYQKLVEGRSWKCVNWRQVGGATALGAVTGGAAGGSFALKAGSNTWKATRPWLGKTGFAKPSQPVHHWLIEQNSKLGKKIPDHIKNQPWNLNPMSASRHQALHKLDPVSRTVAGAPNWAKGAGTGGGVAAMGPDGCGCE